MFVAETDAAAREWALRSTAATFWGKTLKLAETAGWTSYLKADPNDDSVVDHEWLVGNHFLVGSPSTVIEKLHAMHDTVGGFGGILMSKYDSQLTEDVRAERRSLELFQSEVMPGFSELVPDGS
ncbi:hypothetical protein [Nocardioides jensenii]|uniref:hypothetical protein n=1 Tax=Nocardioides jensenii TaxID=1843 RepID=UPI00082B35D6|nr:hypothetical protein [Nocardioides jensenii]